MSAAWPRREVSCRVRRGGAARLSISDRGPPSRFPLRRDKSMRVAIDARELCGRPTGVAGISGSATPGRRAGGTPPQWTLIAPAGLKDRRGGPRRRIRGAARDHVGATTLPRAVRAAQADVFLPRDTCSIAVAAPWSSRFTTCVLRPPGWFSSAGRPRRRSRLGPPPSPSGHHDTDSRNLRSAFHRIAKKRLRVIPLGSLPVQPIVQTAVLDRPIRRFVISAAACRSFDSRVRSGRRSRAGRASRDCWRESNEPARRLRIDSRRLPARRSRQHSIVRGRWRAGVALRSRVGVCVSLRIRRLRTDAARTTDAGVPPIVWTLRWREKPAAPARVMSALRIDETLRQTIAEYCVECRRRQSVLRHRATCLNRYDWDSRRRRDAVGARGGAGARSGQPRYSSSSPTTRRRRSRVPGIARRPPSPFPTTDHVVDNASPDRTRGARATEMAGGAGHRRGANSIRQGNNIGSRARTATTCCESIPTP